MCGEQVLHEGPDAVSKDRVSATDHEVEQLLAAAEIEPDWRSKGGMISQPVEAPLESVRCHGRRRLHCAILPFGVVPDRSETPGLIIESPSPASRSVQVSRPCHRRSQPGGRDRPSLRTKLIWNPPTSRASVSAPADNLAS